MSIDIKIAPDLEEIVVSDTAISTEWNYGICYKADLKAVRAKMGGQEPEGCVPDSHRPEQQAVAGSRGPQPVSQPERPHVLKVRRHTFFYIRFLQMSGKIRNFAAENIFLI